MAAENSTVSPEKIISPLTASDGLAKAPEKLCEKLDAPTSTSKTGITSNHIEPAAGNYFLQILQLHFLRTSSSETAPVAAPTSIRSKRKLSGKSKPAANLITVHVGDHVSTSMHNSEMVIVEPNDNDHSGHHQSYAYNLKTEKINMLSRDKILGLVPGTVAIMPEWHKELEDYKERARQKKLRKTPE